MKIFKLSDIADIQAGYQARTGIKEVKNGTHRIIQGKDFDSFNRLTPASLSLFIPERKAENYLVKKNDVLIQSRGTAHYAYCIKEELSNTLAAGSFYILRLRNESILPEYLCWWLNQKRSQNYLTSQATATIISFIKKKSIAQLKVKIPLLEVQNSIVMVFSMLNKEKTLLYKYIEKRESLIRATCIKALEIEEKK
jgi:restriction endonuclease S subunit